MLSTPSSSALRRSMRCAGWCSRKRSATVDARATRYGIRTILHCGKERLTDRQRARLDRAIAAAERHDEVHIAWQAARRLSRGRSEGRAQDRRAGPLLVPVVPDPGDQTPRQDPEEVERLVPGLLHHWPLEQRWHRGHHYLESAKRCRRASTPHRPRLPQPRQLPTTHAPHRGRTHPRRAPSPPQV